MEAKSGIVVTKGWHGMESRLGRCLSKDTKYKISIRRNLFKRPIVQHRDSEVNNKVWCT